MEWHIKLKIRRITLKLTREEAANLIGVSVVTYGRWERGENMPLLVYRNIIENSFKDENIFKEVSNAEKFIN